MNEPALGVNQLNQKRVFKHNGPQGFPDDFAFRMIDIKEVVLSHLVQRILGIPTLPYEDAVLQSDERELQGISTPYIPGLFTLLTESVDRISNPDEAVAGAVAMAWFGDLDFLNDSNVWILPDGKALVACDFGMTLGSGVVLDGWPLGNRTVLQTFAQPHNVEPVLKIIRDLQDCQISNALEEIGRSTLHDWKPDFAESFLPTLLANRDELRKSNPFSKIYS